MVAAAADALAEALADDSDASALALAEALEAEAALEAESLEAALDVEPPDAQPASTMESAKTQAHANSFANDFITPPCCDFPNGIDDTTGIIARLASRGELLIKMLYDLREDE